ncbi:hypothetical protein PseudUWO310_10630 [Pseudanabaena sp. UWO310]|nr:hypothetical protein PseudUWO310_10630 [Pseudanabaena sp. UWO310]
MLSVLVFYSYSHGQIKPQELTGGAKRRQSILGVYVLVQLAIAILMPSYLFYENSKFFFSF